MNISTKGRQAFNVPNTEEGRIFLRLLRKFRNRRWFYRARGRGSRKEHGNQAYIPKDFSEWFAVYLTNPLPPANWHEKWAHVPQPGQAVAPPSLALVSSKVAEWSSPIWTGASVGMDDDGKVYNAGVHGLGETGTYIGIAASQHTGSIGEGEARVSVRLDLSNLGGTMISPPAENAGPAADYAEDDVAELDEEELGLLKEVLFKIHNEYQNQAWDEEKQEVFDSLYKKLVS